MIGRVVGDRRRVLFGPLKGLVCDEALASILGIYELHVQEAIQRHLAPGGIFYDVGGYHGYFSMLASRLVGSAGRVYVFEPLAENRSTLAGLVSANNCHNCVLLPLVISDKVGSACLFLQTHHSTPSLVTPSASSVLVEATTLDDFVSTHPSPTLVKLDVEGAEEMVLRGSKKLLSAELPPTWIVELHTETMEEAVRQVFGQHGYRVEELEPAGQHSGSGKPKHIVAMRSRAGLGVPC